MPLADFFHKLPFNIATLILYINVFLFVAWRLRATARCFAQRARHVASPNDGVGRKTWCSPTYLAFGLRDERDQLGTVTASALVFCIIYLPLYILLSYLSGLGFIFYGDRCSVFRLPVFEHLTFFSDSCKNIFLAGHEHAAAFIVFVAVSYVVFVTCYSIILFLSLVRSPRRSTREKTSWHMTADIKTLPTLIIVTIVVNVLVFTDMDPNKQFHNFYGAADFTDPLNITIFSVIIYGGFALSIGVWTTLLHDILLARKAARPGGDTRGKP